uniref:hypothetical protein n=1 Tax=Gelidibacter sp. TaxID=2018083 RepID=UPI00404AB074
MKKIISFRHLAILSIGILIISCDKDDANNDTHVTGAYYGTLTTNLESKSYTLNSSKSATALVTAIGNKIEVYCFNEDFVASINLNVFENGDYMNTCFSGEEFKKMYGHSLSQTNMVGYMQNNNAQWMQHLEFEHIESDKHYGSFNMIDNSFNYTFLIDGMEYHFEGFREYEPEEIGF